MLYFLAIRSDRRMKSAKKGTGRNKAIQDKDSERNGYIREIPFFLTWYVLLSVKLGRVTTEAQTATFTFPSIRPPSKTQSIPLSTYYYFSHDATLILFSIENISNHDGMEWKQTKS